MAEINKRRVGVVLGMYVLESYNEMNQVEIIQQKKAAIARITSYLHQVTNVYVFEKN
jgi:hypothetical protein